MKSFALLQNTIYNSKSNDDAKPFAEYGSIWCVRGDINIETRWRKRKTKKQKKQPKQHWPITIGTNVMNANRCAQAREREWDAKMYTYRRRTRNPITVSQLIGVHFIHTFFFFILFLTFGVNIRWLYVYYCQIHTSTSSFFFNFDSILFAFFLSSLYFSDIFFFSETHTIEIRVDYFDYFGVDWSELGLDGM